jgi:excisionase family DNA binding protein
MSNLVLIPLPGIGTLALNREVYEDALAAGRDLSAAPGPSAAPGDEPLVDADQLASSLGVPVTWIESAARQGRIPSLEFGRWRRFRRSEVEAAVRTERERERA